MNTCSNCKFFRQHYSKWGRGYAKINCGHCIKPMLKYRKPQTSACINWELGDSEKETGHSH
jgi:hypothetical protein